MRRGRSDCRRWHDSFTICDMTHSPSVTWLIHYVWHDSFTICDMTHSLCVKWLIHYVWHDSFTICDVTHCDHSIHSDVSWEEVGVIADDDMPHSLCATRLIHYVTWLIVRRRGRDRRLCDIDHSLCVTWLTAITLLILTYSKKKVGVLADCVTWLIHYVWRDSFTT